MHMTPEATAASKPVTGKGSYKAGGERGNVSLRGLILRLLISIKLFFLVLEQRPGDTTELTSPALPSNTALRFLGSTEMACESLHGPVSSASQKSQTQALSG